MTRRRQVQLLLWSYFWLLIFEGALRKWVFPGFSNQLLLIRDPIAIWAIVAGAPFLTRSRWTAWVATTWIIGILGTIFALFFGHGDVVTALFGARVFCFHIPLIFLFSLVFDQDDVWNFIKALAITAIPMTFLAAAQYSLPQDHLVNRAPGGMEGGGFSGALGRFRPPGTFSFINGLVEFYGLASAAVVAIFLAGKPPLPRWIYASLLAIIVVLPISISRSLLYKYIINGIMASFAAASSLRNLVAAIAFTLILLAASWATSHLGTVQDAREAFLARWEEATEMEGQGQGALFALQQRTQSGTLDEIKRALEQPIFGHGIGLGTNVGAVRVSGFQDFLVSESAWGNLIGELGPLLGGLALAFRIGLVLLMIQLMLKELRKGNTLPTILSGVAIIAVLFGTTSQPTSLGFVVLCSGLMLAACNSPKIGLFASDGADTSQQQDSSWPENFAGVDSSEPKHYS
ncbi:MAG: hypothetical protein KGR46_02075 [Verrucomicrobia bacterium]|nr:hypothetical protein [Verrucomicrobiota bacterium]